MSKTRLTIVKNRRIGLVERSISGLSRTLTDTFSLLGGDISSAQRVFQGVLGLGAFEVAAGKVIGGGAAAGVAGRSRNRITRWSCIVQFLGIASSCN